MGDLSEGKSGNRVTKNGKRLPTTLPDNEYLLVLYPEPEHFAMLRIDAHAVLGYIRTIDIMPVWLFFR